MSAELHICSLVVTALPASLDSVRTGIKAIDGAEVAASDAVGKLVVTLETNDDADIGHALVRIESLHGVLAAALVFHHIEPASSLAEEPLCQSHAATS